MVDSRLQWLVSNYLDQHALAPSAIEFAVENLFPRSEIQFALADCDDDFPAHDLPLQMGVGVVFAGPVVSIAGGRRMRSQFFQPKFVIVMESWFIVIDEHGGSDVHGVDQAKAFGHAALVNEFLNLRCDVDEAASIRHFEPKMFSERFQYVKRIGAYFNKTQSIHHKAREDHGEKFQMKSVCSVASMVNPDSSVLHALLSTKRKGAITQSR